MDRTMKVVGAGLLLAVSALHAGCGSSAGGLSTASVGGDTPGIANDDPLARPIQVAWTSARAQRCGFNFDTAKLRSSYLAYEAKQGTAGEQLAKAQAGYDKTFQTISARVSSDPDYCTDKRSSLIKADLSRHLAGDFAPNLPKPQAADPCGFFGCSAAPDPNEKFDAKKTFDELDKKKR